MFGWFSYLTVCQCTLLNIKIERILCSEFSQAAKCLTKVKAFLCIQKILSYCCYHFYTMKLMVKVSEDGLWADFICVHMDNITSQDIQTNLGNKNLVCWHSFYNHTLTLSFLKAMTLNEACNGNCAQCGIDLKSYKLLVKILIYGNSAMGFIFHKDRILLYANHQGTICCCRKDIASL